MEKGGGVSERKVEEKVGGFNTMMKTSVKKITKNHIFFSKPHFLPPHASPLAHLLHVFARAPTLTSPPLPPPSPASSPPSPLQTLSLENLLFLTKSFIFE